METFFRAKGSRFYDGVYFCSPLKDFVFTIREKSFSHVGNILFLTGELMFLSGELVFISGELKFISGEQKISREEKTFSFKAKKILL
jgi:hypothetical protein